MDKGKQTPGFFKKIDDLMLSSHTTRKERISI
jgi:hypothetical protein